MNKRKIEVIFVHQNLISNRCACKINRWVNYLWI